MTTITQTVTVIRFIRQHIQMAVLQQEQQRSVQMEPTASVSIEVGLAPIMGALQNGSDTLEERTELEAEVLRLKGREDGVLQEMKALQARRPKMDSV
jgi:hypothetical protein